MNATFKRRYLWYLKNHTLTYESTANLSKAVFASFGVSPKDAKHFKYSFLSKEPSPVRKQRHVDKKTLDFIFLFA